MCGVKKGRGPLFPSLWRRHEVHGYGEMIADPSDIGWSAEAAMRHLFFVTFASSFLEQPRKVVDPGTGHLEGAAISFFGHSGRNDEVIQTAPMPFMEVSSFWKPCHEVVPGSVRSILPQAAALQHVPYASVSWCVVEVTHDEDRTSWIRAFEAVQFPLETLSCSHAFPFGPSPSSPSGRPVDQEDVEFPAL